MQLDLFKISTLTNLLKAYFCVVSSLTSFVLFYREALMRAKLLLSMKHGLARLDNVWGIGGGQRPVVYLINKVSYHVSTSLLWSFDMSFDR